MLRIKKGKEIREAISPNVFNHSFFFPKFHSVAETFSLLLECSSVRYVSQTGLWLRKKECVCLCTVRMDLCLVTQAGMSPFPWDGPDLTTARPTPMQETHPTKKLAGTRD